MRVATAILNFSLMLLIPIALGVFLRRRLGTPWRLFVIGAVTFVASQVVHLPVNAGLQWLFDNGVIPLPPENLSLITSAVLLGLTAGLSEELARYLAYRYWIKDARTWRQGLMFGAGHGGIEALIVGGVTALATVQFIALRGVDLITLPLTPEQLAALQQQVEAFWATPWFGAVLGAYERLLAIILHLSLALLVLQAVVRNNKWWLAAAILWHTFANALVVYILRATGSIYWPEAALTVVALVSLGLIFALRRPEPPAAEAAAPPPEAPAMPQAPNPPAAAPTAEQLERSKYQ